MAALDAYKGKWFTGYIGFDEHTQFCDVNLYILDDDEAKRIQGTENIAQIPTWADHDVRWEFEGIYIDKDDTFHPYTEQTADDFDEDFCYAWEHIVTIIKDKQAEFEQQVR